jgi:hypothetical protein
VNSPIEIFVTFDGEDVEDVLIRTLAAFEKQFEQKGDAAIEGMDLKWKTLWKPETM